MKQINFISNKRSVSFVIILMFLLATAFSLLMYYFVFNNIITSKISNTTYGHNQVTAINAKNYVEQALQNNLDLLAGIEAAEDHIDDITDQELDLIVGDILGVSSNIEGVEILDLTGEITYAYPTNPQLIGIDRSGESYFGTLAYEEYQFTGPYLSALSEDLRITLAHKSLDTYIIAYISLEFFDTLYLDIKESNDTKNLMILDKYGIFVYDSASTSEETRIRYPLFDELVDSMDNNEATVLDVHGTDSIISTSYLEEYGWYVTIYEAETVSTVLFQEFSYILSFFVLMLIFIYLLSVIHSMVIIKGSLSIIYSNLKKVSDGKFGHKIEDLKYKEFVRIGDQFNHMSESLYSSNKKLESLAYVDNLTNQHSRNYIKHYFEEEITENPYINIAGIYLDIKRFNIINESYGYEIGDEVLQKVASMLSSLTSEDILLTRIESDEFLITIKSRDDIDVDPIIKEIKKLFVDPILIKQIEIIITVSIGVSMYPLLASSFENLVSTCVIALNEGKRNGLVAYHVFDPSMLQEFSRKVEIEISIDKAFINNEFYVVMQPIVNMNDESIRGFEALSRWNHPQLGNVSPGEYIELLETSKKIHSLDKLVVNQAVKYTKQLSKKFNRSFIISCNISAETIIRDDFVSYIREIINRYDFNPYFLELEVTESTIIKDFQKVQKTISELRLIGVRFSEDDFGDGYSSLTYLTRLDLSTLKISRNFLEGIESNFNNRMLLNSIINLSKDLGFETIVEGIETESILNIFKEFDVDYVQGFYFYRPVEYEEIEKILAKQNKK